MTLTFSHSDHHELDRLIDVAKKEGWRLHTWFATSGSSIMFYAVMEK